MEKPTKILEENESAERPARYRTIFHEKFGTSEQGGSLERVIECNGTQHRECEEEVFYDKDGQIEFVNELSRRNIGACDGKHT